MSESQIPPNQGATVPDVVAVGDDQESQGKWLERNNIKVDNRIKLKKLSHMRYQHPDLDELHKFMIDFGMEVAKKTDDEVWFRGYGPDQYVYYARKGPKKFLGGAFVAETREDFERAARFPQTGPVEGLHDDPGGGSLVSIIDPEGFPVNVVFGQDPVEVLDAPREKVVLNYPEEKPRKRMFNRFEPGPVPVYKLGHFGLCTQQFGALLEFYTNIFNIVPTDLLHVDKDGQKMPVTAFMHLDLGETHVDHHSFFLSANPTSAHVHHASFEVHDYDAQQLGHQWLAQKGYKLAWGVGRHVLGSQIFDYWWDVSGNMVEHYTDGDLVNRDTPVGHSNAGSGSLAIWGPEVPKAFLK